MIDETNHQDTADIERRLEAERPVPHAGFRGELRRRLVTASTAARPRRIRMLVAAYGGSGLMLLVVAAIGVAGAGPFAA